MFSLSTISMVENIKRYMHLTFESRIIDTKFPGPLLKKEFENIMEFLKNIGLTVAFTISDNINETSWYCPAFYYADLDSCK